jgi:hypothetical protein
VITPGGTLVDPFSKNIDFILAEWFVFIRHPVFGITQRQPPDHFTFTGLSGNDGRFSRLCRCKCILAEQQTESTLAFHATMTADAFFIEDGFDLCIKIDGMLIPGA